MLLDLFQSLETHENRFKIETELDRNDHFDHQAKKLVSCRQKRTALRHFDPNKSASSGEEKLIVKKG